MNCRNCGASTRTAGGHGRFVCDYCQTQTLVDLANCSPGTADGLAWLQGPVSAEPGCPTCGPALEAAILDGHAVSACRTCHGALLNRDAFAQIVRRRRVAYVGPEDAPAPIDPRELARPLRCPSCRRPMETHPYYGPGAVVIDTCTPCGLVWMDRGELLQIERVPGRRRW